MTKYYLHVKNDLFIMIKKIVYEAKNNLYDKQLFFCQN